MIRRPERLILGQHYIDAMSAQYDFKEVKKMGIHIGTDFAQLHGDELLAFIFEALHYGYGSESIAGDDNTTDGSSKVVYEKDDWRYQDVYYGGEPYSGQTTIFYKGVACWNMVYFGKVLPHVDNKQYIYDCLRPALMAASPNFPFRGPSVFIADNDLRYANIGHGNVVQFYGQESIKDENDECLFETYYFGGIVNLR